MREQQQKAEMKAKRRYEEQVKGEELRLKERKKSEEQAEEQLRLEDMRRQEEERMRQEAQVYENYRRHLEEKKKSQFYDSDDYASEWDLPDDEEEAEEAPKASPHQEEKFEELQAQSEEELYEAQEKSIRNLERQIRKQSDREKRRRSEKQQGARRPQAQQAQEATGPQRWHSASTGDLRASRTLPVTKFSPDPMEFGFRPIERPHA